MSEHKFKVLVVEDDLSARVCWETIFSQRGWDVATAGTVAEGLILLDPVPDYLILDLGLPDGDGAVILRAVRQKNLKTRVAVTTGNPDSARLRGVKALRPEAVFEKPVDVVAVWRQGELARAS